MNKRPYCLKKVIKKSEKTFANGYFIGISQEKTFNAKMFRKRTRNGLSTENVLTGRLG